MLSETAVFDSLNSYLKLYILWNISSKLISFTESSTVKSCDPSFEEATPLTATLLQLVEQSFVVESVGPTTHQPNLVL